MEEGVIVSLKVLDETIIVKNVPLELVLDQSEKITENVKKAADQISSVNTVLKQEKVSILVPTIEEAIAQNKEAEQKVAKAAEDLHQVNTELAKQVTERTEIESELRKTRSDLLELRADLSRSQAKEEDALQIALHDTLTGLPNRLLFKQRLDHGLIQARRHGWKLAVMFIDLDKFKNINDSYGHDIGDKVLITAAKRLQSFIRDEDMVSRWGGDEFVCVLLNIKLESEAINLAKKMVDLIAEKCEFDGIIISITATIGIAVCPMDGETADILLEKVDRAMYKSKGTDKRVMLFRESV